MEATFLPRLMRSLRLLVFFLEQPQAILNLLQNNTTKNSSNERVKIMGLFKKILSFLFLLAASNPILDEANLHLKDTAQSKIYMNSVINLNIAPKEGGHIISEATGFGVAIDKKNRVSYVLTNAHFCSHFNSTSEQMFFERSDVILSNTVQYVSGYLQVVAMSPEKDLCLLMTDRYITPVNIAKNYAIKKMDPVISVGSPFGIFPIITPTYISDYASRDYLPPDQQVGGAPLLLLSGTVIPGQSGSPIFNQKGEVIGIIMGYINPNPPLFLPGGIAISYVDIRDFLEGLQLKF